jgi:hypothetical protein
VAEVEHPVLLQPAHLIHELARLVGCHLCSRFLCSAKLGLWMRNAKLGYGGLAVRAVRVE